MWTFEGVSVQSDIEGRPSGVIIGCGAVRDAEDTGAFLFGGAGMFVSYITRASWTTDKSKQSSDDLRESGPIREV